MFRGLAILALLAFPGGTFLLDQEGTRGVVVFDHSTHQSRTYPDPSRTSPGAPCLTCHHSRNTDGTPQLLSCHRCHFEHGNAQNPKTKELIELSKEKVFHENCMDCHRASQKGPRLCTSCHREQ